MDKVLEFMGFPTTGKGRTWGIIALISMLSNVADLFNFADPIGITKKTLNKFLPSVFGVDKFRKVTAPTRASTVQELGRSLGV